MIKESVIVTLLLVATLFGSVPVLSEELEPASEGVPRFQLYVACQPIHVIVEEQTPDAKEIGLTRTRIMAAAEARLRAARIFSEKMTAPFFLHIQVVVARQAFHVQLSLMKRVMDYFSLKDNFAYTWKRDAIGTHVTDSMYILSNLSMLLDEFIAEYFRVNQDACEQK